MLSLQSSPVLTLHPIRVVQHIHDKQYSICRLPIFYSADKVQTGPRLSSMVSSTTSVEEGYFHTLMCTAGHIVNKLVCSQQTCPCGYQETGRHGIDGLLEERAFARLGLMR